MGNKLVYLVVFLLCASIVSATNVNCGWGNAACKEDDVQDAVDELDDDISDIREDLSNVEDFSEDIDSLNTDVSDLNDDMDDVKAKNVEQDEDIEDIEKDNFRQDVAIGFNYLIDFYQGKQIRQNAQALQNNDAAYRQDRVGGGVSSSFVYRTIYGVSDWRDETPFIELIAENYVLKTSYYKLETRVAMIQAWAQSLGYVEDDLDAKCARRWGDCGSDIQYVFLE